MEKREETSQIRTPAATSRAIACVDALILALTRTISLQQNLVNILEEEYAHMTSLDVKGLIETAQAKEFLLSEILDAETVRIKATDALGAALGMMPENATLLKLSQAVPAPWAAQLGSARTALVTLMSRAKEFNSRNSQFAESSLVHIEEMKRNVLGLNHTGTKENYSNVGVREPILEHGGRLLDSKA